MKRVLFITTSHKDLGDSGVKTGLWLEEVATPYYRLREESIHVEIASVNGGFQKHQNYRSTSPVK